MAASIVARALAYRHADGTLQVSDVDLSLEPARYGLIGANGAGKTTLLRLFAREHTPSSGTLTVRGSTHHLAQHDDCATDLTLAAFFGTDVEAYRIRRALGRVGIGDVALERSLSTLSGGELIRVRLARAVVDEPDWLLLDEPSSHLDGDGRAALYDIVATWRGGLVVASHDRELLERVDAILELGNLGLRRYGGAYELYRRQRRLEDASAEQAAASARASLARERKALQLAVERTQRRNAAARRQAVKANVPKVMRGAMERGAQVTAAKRRGVHEDRLSAQALRLEAARASQRVVRTIDVDVPESAVPAGKVVVASSDLDLHVGGVRLWAVPVSLSVIGPERIALRGANGSGKSTLLRYLAEHAHVRTAYLDQRLELLPENLTLAEAMRDAAPALAEHDRRVRLGRLGFEQERTEARIAILSGGERMRAALALLFVRPDPPQLLLLDEPETHLDLTSLDELVTALDGFHGALIVVSHDAGFVRAIGAGRAVELARGPGPR